MSKKQQQAQQAITPSSMDFIRQVRVREKTEDMDPMEATDRKLAALADMDGWATLRDRIQERIEQVRNLRDVDSIYTMDETEIGKRFIIASLVVENLEWVLGMVEAPKQYYAEKDNTTPQQ